MTIETIEVFKKIDNEAGRIERELYELNIDPNTLYFGNSVGYITADDEQSTTENTYQLALRLTTPELHTGDQYIVFWHASIKSSLQNKTVSMRVQVDDTLTEVEIEHEGNEYANVSGFAIYTSTSDSTHTVEIDWLAGPLATGYIRRCRLIVWEIGHNGT